MDLVLELKSAGGAIILSLKGIGALILSVDYMRKREVCLLYFLVSQFFIWQLETFKKLVIEKVLIATSLGLGKLCMGDAIKIKFRIIFVVLCQFLDCIEMIPNLIRHFVNRHLVNETQVENIQHLIVRHITITLFQYFFFGSF